MKQLKVLASLLFLGLAPARGQESSNYSPESRTVMETFTSKVLRIYSFEEDDSQYVAYVVNWKDHEVVVTPFASDARYNVGDTVRCQMQQTSAKIGDPNKARIIFSLLPNTASLRRPPETAPSPTKSP